MGNERKPQDDKGKQPNRIEDPIPKRPEISDPDLDVERDDRNANPNPNNPSLDPERKGSIDRQGNR